MRESFPGRSQVLLRLSLSRRSGRHRGAEIHPRRRYRGPLPKVVSERDIKRLVLAASTPRNKAIIELMYATGCRASEIVAMRVEQIDFRRCTVIVRGKGSERRVFFGAPAKRALKAYL